MKAKSRVIAILIAFAMILTMNMYPASVYAASEGTGTESDPYIITTAEELQEINNDLSAYYKLGSDINLNGNEFTPIGNADAGTFSGSFDGNGYTISNLYVDTGKYAGLFGCSEGSIKNVRLENVDITGSRYLGGVVGQNTVSGSISDCSVTGGSIKTKEGPGNVCAGGICGSSEGDMTGVFTNTADITAENNEISAGGIAGYIAQEVNLEECWNTGDIKANVPELTDSANILINAYVYAGGIAGKVESSSEMISCWNSGNINVTSDRTDAYGNRYIYTGGISANNSTVKKSYNSGSAETNVYGLNHQSVPYTYSGGIVGYNGNVSECYNTGVLKGQLKSGYGEYGNLYIAGISGAKGTVTNCYNTGNIHGTSGYYLYISGIANDSTIANCYNAGGIEEHAGSHNGSYFGVGYLVGKEAVNSYSNCYTSRYKALKFVSHDLKNPDIYLNWDFENIWTFEDGINGNMPILKNAVNNADIDVSTAVLPAGNQISLNAYESGMISSGYKWSTSDNAVATVGKNGAVLGTGAGLATITGINDAGEKVNCNIFVYTGDPSLQMKDFAVTDASKSYALSAIFGSTADYITKIESSNPEVLYIGESYWGGYEARAQKPGTAVITAETFLGAESSCTVTVTDIVRQINLPSSFDINRGETKSLGGTIIPQYYTNSITWTSSDESVATVNQEGYVTGHKLGQAIITAKSDTGVTDTCVVNIKAPIESMAFEKTDVTLYKGDEYKLGVVVSPADTTEAVQWYSNDTSIVTVDSEGLLTAKAAGETMITARASGDSTRQITIMVKVLDHPVIVTGVELDQNEHDMKVGEIFKLTALVIPEDATNSDVTWASTDETVASVNEAGTVTAVGAGKTMITATSENGIVAACTVNVEGTASTNISKIYIPEIIATEEEYIDVPVMIENNPGISFASVKVIYDGSQMEAESIENGTVFDSAMGSIDNEKFSVQLNFVSSNDVTDDGVLALIRFKLPANAEAQTYDLKVCYYPGGIRNAEQEAVAFNLKDGLMSAPACSHANTHLEGVVEASCKTQGYTGNTVCDRCGYVVAGNTVSKKAHAYGEWKTDRQPTCTAEGSKIKICTVCGDTLTQTIKAKGHIDVTLPAVAATCAKAGKTEGTKCSVCKTVLTAQKTVAATGKHVYGGWIVSKKATTSENGSMYKTCNTCNKKVTSVIYKISKTTLSKTSYVYDGKVKKPAVKVLNSKQKTLTNGTDYNIKIKTVAGKAVNSPKAVGKYNVTISFKGKYKGSVTKSYTVKPKATTISTLKAGDNRFTVKWTKRTAQVTGYQIRYSTKSGFTSATTKTVTVKGASKVSKTIKSLKNKKLYYVQVRTYKTVNGEKIYSKWSATSKIKTK